MRHNRVLSIILIILVSCIVVISIVLFMLNSQVEFTIAIMNDVHLEPNYDPWAIPEESCLIGKQKSTNYALYGRHYCDSPYSLFLSALRKMKSVKSSPNVILVPGDLVTHTLPLKINKPFDEETYKEIKKTIANYSKTISNEFPGIPIIYTMGNNDYLYHYQVPDLEHKRAFYEFLYDQWIVSNAANWKAVFSYLSILEYGRKQRDILQNRKLFYGSQFRSQNYFDQ